MAVRPPDKAQVVPSIVEGRKDGPTCADERPYTGKLRRRALAETPSTSPALPSELPALPLRNTVVFPQTLQPLAVNRPVSLESVNRALAADRLLLLVTQAEDTEELTAENLKRIGTVGVLRQMAP